jgi:hypothetical protein
MEWFHKSASKLRLGANHRWPCAQPLALSEAGSDRRVSLFKIAGFSSFGPFAWGEWRIRWNRRS